MENQIVTKHSIKDFFLNLGSQVAIYSVIISLVTLFFKIINKTYQSIDYGYYYYSNEFSVSFPVSLIIVVFPVYILLQYILEREYVSNPELKQTTIRKFLTYVTLFISGMIIVGNLVYVLYMYIDGQDLATGFLLKVLVLFVISILVFAYYLNDMKDKVSIKAKKVIAIISLAFILFSIILAFSIIGSPRTQRLMKYDEQKVESLRNLKYYINEYYRQNGKLPEKLADVNESYYTIPVDPQTKDSYVYKKSGSVDYKLCAEFNLDYSDHKTKVYYGNGSIRDMNDINSWEYTKGEHCFDLKVDDYIIQDAEYRKKTPVPVSM